MVKKKKGVSEMIGYILLISFAVVISAVVYTWLKSYVPQDTLECPEDVSLMLKNYSCNSAENTLTLNIKNNGRFSVGGIFINIRNDSTQKLATKDISKYVHNSTGTYLGLGTLKFKDAFSNEDNSLDPNEEISLKFNLNNTGFGQIYSIDLNPIRWQEEDKKMQSVNCGNAKVTEQLKDCFAG
jgi:hypothetical protein